MRVIDSIWTFHIINNTTVMLEPNIPRLSLRESLAQGDRYEAIWAVVFSARKYKGPEASERTFFQPVQEERHGTEIRRR